MDNTKHLHVPPPGQVKLSIIEFKYLLYSKKINKICFV